MKGSKYLLGASALAVAAMIAPLAPALADDEVIAVFTKNLTNPFFQNERVAAENAAKQLKAKIVQYTPTKPDSIPEQLSQIEDVIVKKPAAAVFVPVDYKAMVPGIEKMNAAGIPVVNITDHLAGGKIVAFVGIDDVKVATTTAESLIKAMGGKGNVVIIEGVKGSISSQDRVKGFNEVIKKYPDVKLLASQPGNFQRLNALQAMENLLQTHDKIDGVLAANDAMAIGAIEALDGAKRKAIVVGINGTKEAVDAIKAGTLLSSGQADPFMQACIGTTIAIRHLRKLPILENIILKPSVIDKSNFAEFDKPVDQRNCPSWDEIAKAN